MSELETRGIKKKKKKKKVHTAAVNPMMTSKLPRSY